MKKINFEDIRVGDVIEARATYGGGGDVVTWRGAVTHRSADSFETQMFPFARSNSLYEYFLDERPKPTFKVGDTIMGEQVADLPDGAVFDLNDGGVTLRYKINGYVYSARGSVLSLDTYRAINRRGFKIVFLPEA